jgi:hypothetical protein
LERQHSVPLLLSSSSGGAQPLKPAAQQGGDDAVSEAYIQALVHEHPACLPIAEIDAMFSGPVPICTELNTPAGPIDNFMVTPSGLPVLVECKLWRNPEARREVVSQILDYAKELSRWSSSDVQREVSHRLKRDGNPLLDMVRAVDPEVDEQQFNDALTANLRRGRFLLLIVGDGIREGVEAIAEYLQLHAGLHFSLGLVELPIYVMPNGDRLVAPRVLARTALVTRNVVAVPDGYLVDEAGDPTSVAEIDPERAALGDQLSDFGLSFWTITLSWMIRNNRSQSQRGWVTSPSLFRRPPAGSQSIVPYAQARWGFFCLVGVTPQALTPCRQSWMSGKRGVQSRTS